MASSNNAEPPSFQSHLLLEDDQIHALGIADHNIENYRRWRYRYSFGIHSWYDRLKEHTFRTSFVEFSYQDAQAILNARLGGKEPFSERLLALTKRLNEVLKDFPNGAFVKLDTRSPKDVPVYDQDDTATKRNIDHELGILTLSQLQDPNEKTALFVRATNKALRVRNGEQAIKLLVSSLRVQEDLGKAIEFGEGVFSSAIVVREWIDEVVNHPEMEFRGFVHKNNLNAVTQYFSFIHFPDLEREKPHLQTKIVDFFESIKDKIPHESYIIDLIVLRDRIMIIELNPFHVGAGAGLFSWRDHRRLFMEGPFQFRVADASVTENAYEYVPPSWQRYIDTQIGSVQETRYIKYAIPVALVVATVVARGAYYYYTHKR